MKTLFCSLFLEFRSFVLFCFSFHTILQEAAQYRIAGLSLFIGASSVTGLRVDLCVFYSRIVHSLPIFHTDNVLVIWKHLHRGAGFVPPLLGNVCDCRCCEIKRNTVPLN